MFKTGFPKDWSTIKKLMWLRLLQGAAAIIKTVTGTAPLTLANALAHSIKSLTQFGKVEQRNLPQGYTELDYIQSDGTQYLNLGISGNADFELTAQIADASYKDTQVLLGSTTSAEYATWYGQVGYITGKPWGVGGVTGGYSTIPSTQKATAWLSFTTNHVEGTVDGESFSRDGTMPNLDWKLFRQTYGTYASAAKVFSLKAWQNNVLVLDLVPAKNASNVLGMYDLVSGQFLTNAGTGSFTAGPDAVPTPNRSMDLWTNNGVLKARHQSGLPLGYQLVAYLDSDGAQRIDPALAGNARWEITAQANAVKGSSQALLSSTPSATGGTWYGEFTSTGYWDVVAGGTTIAATTKATADLTFDGDGVRGTINSTSVNRSVSVTQGAWSIFSTSTNGLPFAGKLFGAKAWQSNILVRDLHPVKRSSDNAVGMYDKVSGQFFANLGTGEFTAGSPVDDPVEIYTDGEDEVLTVRGKNLYNKADGVLKGYPSAAGTWNGRSGDTSELSIIVTLEEGKTYTAQRASGGNCAFRVMGSANRPLEQGQSLMVISSPTSISDDVTTFTVPSGYPHIVFYVRNNAGTSLTTEDVVNAFQVELGSEATAYESYVTPQTVNDIKMLLAVGDIKDTAGIIDGLLTHKIGIKVLKGNNIEDGTWGTSAGASNLYSLRIAGSSTDNTFSPISTHFVGILGSVGYASIQDGQFKHGSNSDTYFFKDVNSADVTAFKAKIAAALAAGNPYIVLYPLATETTEQTTAHALNSFEGTTVVDAKTNVDPVTLSVEYMASA